MKELMVILIALFSMECTHMRLNVEWHSYKSIHTKTYANVDEDSYRMETFLKRKDEIAEHNRLFDLGLATFKMALNKFSDLTDKEFHAHMDGFKLFEPHRNKTANQQSFYKAHDSFKLPKSIDWRDKGAVTSVKDQGDDCGSCWTFSTLGALEGQYFRKTGHLVSLSAQNLIDCTDPHGDGKCSGRTRHEAYDWIIEHGGIESDAKYPYKSHGDHCKYKQKYSVTTLREYASVDPSGDEDQLCYAIATIGPISVTMDATHRSFWYYSTGIYYEPECNEDDVNHAVLAVGFGVDKKGHDYYIIKNSWGEKWGENGYMRLARNKNNNCAIASNAMYPII